MNVVTISADSVPEAVAQVRERLGPDAVVLHVRPLPSTQLSRLWKKPRIELIACRPESSPDSALAELRHEIDALKEHLHTPRAPARRPRDPIEFKSTAQPNGTRDRFRAELESGGLLPEFVDRVLAALPEAARASSSQPSFTAARAREILQRVLSSFWRAPEQLASRLHIFVGAPGAGKTTCLCKWLARSVLMEGQTAHVWRLDGSGANTAESLSVYGEILGVPVDRAWSAGNSAADILFIDLPGVNWADEHALKDLQKQLELFPSAQIHLVLNGAYESRLLLDQVHAFSRLSLSDLIVTHLDEERRRLKLWNLIFGTKFSIRYAGAGQNIPGEFLGALPQDLLTSLFPNKNGLSTHVPAGGRPCA
jgi:flagellar biosynthesis protein FlhF